MITLPILYKQGDTRWGANLLGFNKVAPYDMTNYGCLVTCWAMVDRYYGKDTDPGRLNDTYKGMGVGKAFVSAGGDYIPGGNNLAFGDIKEVRTLTPSLMTDAQIAEIKTSIDNGYPVIIGIDVSPQTVAYNSHFVTVVAYNPAEENDLTIADPITGTLRSLKAYLGWFKPNARNTIESYICTTGPKPKLNAETLPVLKTDFVNLVHNSTEYDKTVEYLRPGSDPKVTQFEDLQTVVAGIKSTQTDLTNKLNAATQATAAAEKEVENQKDKLANVSAECERVLKLKEAELTALKATIPDMAKLEGTYKATIDDLQGKLREAQKAKGVAELETVRVAGELKQCQSGLRPTFADKIRGWLQSIGF